MFNHYSTDDARAIINLGVGVRVGGLKDFFETGSTAGIQAHHADKLNIILTALNVAESLRT